MSTRRYKDYPLALFQIQTKYRDEARPRAGHPARARVHHEGLVLVRSERRGSRERLSGPPRRLRADLHPARVRLPHRLRGVRRDGRLGFGGVPGPDARRRGHLRPVHQLRLRRQHRGRGHRRAASPKPRPTTRRSRSSTPPTPRRSTPWSAPGRRSRSALRPPGAVHRRRHAEERRAADPRAGRAGLASCWWSASPATGRSTSSDWAASSSRSRSPRPSRQTWPRHPELVKGYIGPQILGERPPRSVTWWTPGGRGQCLGHRRECRRASTPPSWCAGGTSCPTGRSARSRSVTATGARAAAARCRSPVGIELGHVFQLGRKYAEAVRAAGARTRRQAGDGHDGLLRRRHHPRGRGAGRADLRRARACAGRVRWLLPTSTSWPPERTTPSSTAAEASGGRARGPRASGALRRPSRRVARA